MDPLNTNQNPIASGNQFPPPEPPKSGIGPIVGAVIIIILLIAGGLYFWGARLNRQMELDMPYIPSNDYWPEESMPPETFQPVPDIVVPEDDVPIEEATTTEAELEAEVNVIQE